MCPTFIATGDEIMSTRGRANTIRAVLERRITDTAAPLTSDALDMALSNCLSCKACKKECPSNVDLALLKAELLHASQRQRGVMPLERLVSRFDLLGRAGCLMPDLANALLQNSLVRTAMEKALGFSARRPLPVYANQRFDHCKAIIAQVVRRTHYERCIRVKLLRCPQTIVQCLELVENVRLTGFRWRTHHGTHQVSIRLLYRARHLRSILRI